MAENSNRDLGAMEERDQREVARKGGESSGEGRSGNNSGGTSKRGLASADKETRQRVARAGGKASHGGGRKSGGSNR